MKPSHWRIAFAFLGFILIGANGGVAGVLIPSMSSYYGVDKTIIGLVFIASSVGYFLAALFSSMLLERCGIRLFLSIGAFTFLLGTLTLGMKPPFLVILVIQFFMGLGVAMMETGLNAYVVTLPLHTSKLNTLHAFYGLGALLGPPIAVLLLTTALGWSSIFLLWTLLSIPLLLGFILFFRSYSLVPAHEENEKKLAGNTWMQALRLPIVWVACIFLLLYVGVEVSLGNWTFSFLVEGRHQPQVYASWIVSAYWSGLTLGRFTLSKLAQRFRLTEINLIYGCIIGVVIGLFIIALFPSDLFAALGFFLIGYFLGPIYPTTVAITPRLVPSHIVSNVIGFLMSTSILGLAAFPWFAGVLAQNVGIWSLLPYVGGLTALMFLFWFLLFRRSDREPSKSL